MWNKSTTIHFLTISTEKNYSLNSTNNIKIIVLLTVNTFFMRAILYIVHGWKQVDIIIWCLVRQMIKMFIVTIVNSSKNLYHLFDLLKHVEKDAMAEISKNLIEKSVEKRVCVRN